MRRQLSGVLPVISTPFHTDESVDFATLSSAIDGILTAGADGVTVAMVSEILRLDPDERREVGERTVEAVAGRGHVILSAGAESTVQAIRLATHAASIGASGIMVNPPLTSRAGADDIRDYYRAIADATDDLPVIVQDASGYVGTPIPLEVLVALLDEFGPTKVQFKPEAAPLGPRLTALMERTGGTARVYEGSGGRSLVESHRRGVVGTMPGPDLVPSLVALWKALESGDLTTAYRIQGALAPMLSLVSSLDSYIAVEKYLLHRQGIFPTTTQRGPVDFTVDEFTAIEAGLLFDQLVQVTNDCAEGAQE